MDELITATTTATSAAVSGGLGDLFGVLSLAAAAFKSKSWALLAGLLLTAVVIGLRFFNVVKKVPDYLVPWATIGLSMLTSVAIGLQTNQRWDVILTTGLGIGLMAIGGWESLAKAIRGLVAKVKG